MAAERQLSLLAAGAPGVDATVRVVRHHLDATSWIDLARTWLAGADELFDWCATSLPWAQRRRPMFGRMVLEPRLTAAVDADGARAPAAVTAMADALSDRYGTPLRHVWANWYRSGRDAVAWHADRIGRSERNPLVAVVTLGGPRPFALRPGPSGADVDVTGGRRWDLHSGDLLVMGGACQHRWEHTVPRRPGAPPRISLTFRAAPALGTPDARAPRSPTVDRRRGPGSVQAMRPRTTATAAPTSRTTETASTERSSPR